MVAGPAKTMQGKLRTSLGASGAILTGVETGLVICSSNATPTGTLMISKVPFVLSLFKAPNPVQPIVEIDA